MKVEMDVSFISKINTIFPSALDFRAFMVIFQRCIKTLLTGELPPQKLKDLVLLSCEEAGKILKTDCLREPLEKALDLVKLVPK